MQTSIMLRLDQNTKDAFQNALDCRSMSAYLRKQIDELIEREKDENRLSTFKTIDEFRTTNIS